MSIIKPLLSAILTGIAVLCIQIFTGFNLLTFSIFYILPLGALIIGALSAIGVGSTIHKSNIKLTKIVKGLVIVWMIILFVGLQYAEYTKTFVSEEGTINLSGEGAHVSEYAASDSEEPFNFVSYTIFSVNNSNVSFYKYGRERLSTEDAPVFNWILYLITAIGFIAGGYLITDAFVTGLKYCDKCKRYLEEIKIGKIEAEADKDRFFELVKGGMNHEQALSEIGIVETPQAEEYYEISHHKCEKCLSEMITSVQYKKNDKGKYDLNNKITQEYELETV